LLARGKTVNGFEMLDKALVVVDEKIQMIECWYYKYAHSRDKEIIRNSLVKIKELVKEGVRSPGWNLMANAERAIMDGHPAPELLKLLAKVIADEEDSEVLEKNDDWRDA
jgi:hypothetical protein